MRQKKALWLLPVMTLLGLCTFSGCSSLYEKLAARLTPSPHFVQPTGAALLTVTPKAAAVTPTLPDNCAFIWSNRSLPEVSTEINQEFRRQGLAEVEVEALAYGESCLDPSTNQVVGFLPLQTDIFLNVAVVSVDDHQDLGEWIEKSIRILNEFPPGKIPGPNPGVLGVSFNSGSNVVNLSFPMNKAKNLIDEGLRGGELFDALNEL